MKRSVAMGALVAMLVAAVGVGSVEASKLYIPRKGKVCRRGYRPGHKKLAGHQVRVCIKRRKHVATTRPLKLHAHLDPSYVQDLLNPFRVTYDFSASASQEPVGAAASVGSEQPADLPPGVLSFYSDGILECAINVGDGVEGGKCPVIYQALGQHRVTTIYSSGEQSATATEVETISPIGTSTSMTVSFDKLPYADWEPWRAKVTGGPFEQSGWKIGTVAVRATNSAPGGAGLYTSLECRQSEADCYQPEAQPVGSIVELGVYILHEGPEGGIFQVSFRRPQNNEGFSRWLEYLEYESGVLYLRALTGCSGINSCGYGTSESKVPLQFELGTLPGEPAYSEIPQP